MTKRSFKSRNLNCQFSIPNSFVFIIVFKSRRIFFFARSEAKTKKITRKSVFCWSFYFFPNVLLRAMEIQLLARRRRKDFHLSIAARSSYQLKSLEEKLLTLSVKSPRQM
jgi:hypothetical protein